MFFSFYNLKHIKKLLWILIFCSLTQILFTQNPGDTIIVQTFDYSMTYGQAWGPPRDTIAYFPSDPNLTFEKIIMVYSMRCKDGLVNTSGGNNVACGEWDYSCHTYIHDSTRIDSLLYNTASYSITGFSGTTYDYSSSPTYNYFYLVDSLGAITLDSVMTDSDTIMEFGIITNYGTLNHDIIDTLSVNTYWQPYSYTYDTSGNILSIDTMTIDGTINITYLNYYKRYPMAFQIMSFVTPYGIGLDLGVDGKTWYFDLTDYAPVFKGSKRITVSGGGQWQEDMDIKFLFIVGTPPRNVLEMQQIWRPQSKGYGTIIANDAFEPRDVLLNPNATEYKLRTVITGHGQQGEFIAQNHYLNIDGGPQEYIWPVWTECAENPIFPQGGTWIYDRAGWCPGQASDLREDNITSLVNPGQVHNIDYGVINATGTSNYWVSSQLVSYDSPNHSLDGAVIDILSPTNQILHMRTNPICSKPKIIIQNTGSTPLTTLRIEYWINNAPTHESYQWTGNLSFLEKEEVELPASVSFWDAIDLSGGITLGQVITYEDAPNINTFHVLISNPNGGADEYFYNNNIASTFTPPPKYPNTFTFWYGTNNGVIGGVCETSWEISDNQGNIVYVGNSLLPNTQYKDTISFSEGCYTLNVIDTDDDGIDFWANNDGGGMLRFRRLQSYLDSTSTPWTYHSWFKTFEGDFGAYLHHEFIINPVPSNIVEELKSHFIVFPNPVTKELLIEGNLKSDGKLMLFDKLGRVLQKQMIQSGNFKTKVNMLQYPNGMYFVEIKERNNKYVKKIVKQ